MHLTFRNMKNLDLTLKRLFAVCFLFIALAAPLRGQTDDPTTNENPSAVETNGATASTARSNPPHKSEDLTGDQIVQIVRNATAASSKHRPSAEILIPIVAILASFGFPVLIVGIFYYSRFRKDKMLHETLRTMIDKGVPIPPELLKPAEADHKPRQRNDLRKGLVLVAVGIGLVVMLNTMHNKSLAGVGFIPLLIGVAFLIVWKLERNKSEQPEK
jgi:hypothetical protein